MTTVVEKSHGDIEQGGHRRSVCESDGGSDGSLCFSDAEDRSWHSPFDSNGGGSYDDFRLSNVSDPEIGRVSEPNRNSSVSDHSVEVDLEPGVPEIKVHLAKVEKDCRICHLSLESTNPESGIPIELGCSCKEDLAAAHKHCAEAWFKIKGNKTCEICGSTARNVVGVSETEFMDQWNETSNTTAAAPTPPVETRSFWHGHRFLNFLLACMVFAFVISWLFHFNVPS
ncbi:zinc finger protein [Macleaya cordata]|uniref:Zinc finger protein n=1 Tax=Macleaya cordata TaxID=56857 RepID=A0A200R4V0_MACCD|nr:zinc finger protein [Macleaya cordata]